MLGPSLLLAECNQVPDPLRSYTVFTLSQQYSSMPHAEKDTVNGEMTTHLTNGEKPQSKVLSVRTIPLHHAVNRSNRAATFHPTSRGLLMAGY